jgi:DNA polymerase-3 subunit gamma/tau
VHGRELLAAQVLGEVPPELRVTPERDRRLVEQAAALQRTDAVRLLDLISGALEATTNGADARIQLELVLLKAAMPEIDPSTSALLARIERLEAGAPQRVAATPAPAEAVPAPAAPAAPAAAAPVAPPPPAPARAVANGGSGAQPARAVEPDPEPSPEPEPAFVPAVAVALSVDDAERLWPAVVDTVRQDNAMLAALLADAHAVAIGERELTLAFPSGAAFLKRKAEQDDNRRIATKAWRTISGQDLSLRYELREIGEEQAGAPAMSGEELVRRFIEEFDAEEIVADDSDAGQPEQEQDA